MQWAGQTVWGPPDSVAIWQLQSWLHTQPGAAAGQTLLDQANAVATAAGPPVSLWWTALATQVSRTDPGLATFGAQLGLTTQAQIDAAFVAAASITLP